ncbi:MAG: hypothetical protein H0U22_11110 [Geodermatophilaceae bacterium]|nr:hypothetical protein [Geodermatophilaceae bacterium]
MEQPAEAVASFNVVDLGRGVVGEWSLRSGLAERVVRSVSVVVALALRIHRDLEIDVS